MDGLRQGMALSETLETGPRDSWAKRSHQKSSPAERSEGIYGFRRSKPIEALGPAFLSPKSLTCRLPYTGILHPGLVLEGHPVMLVEWMFRQICLFYRRPMQAIKKISVVPEVRVELTRAKAHWILSPARLPVPPLRHAIYMCVPC